MLNTSHQNPPTLNLMCSADHSQLVHPIGAGPVSSTQTMIAAQFYMLRNEYDVEPFGRYDRLGCWYPDSVEHRVCCDAVRFPSPKFWYAMRDHARTYKHISQMFGVEAKELIKAVRDIPQLSDQQQQHLLDQALLVDRSLRSGSHIHVKKSPRRGSTLNANGSHCRSQ